MGFDVPSFKHIQNFRISLQEANCTSLFTHIACASFQRQTCYLTIPFSRTIRAMHPPGPSTSSHCHCIGTLGDSAGRAANINDSLQILVTNVSANFFFASPYLSAGVLARASQFFYGLHFAQFRLPRCWFAGFTLLLRIRLCLLSLWVLDQRKKG